MASAVHCLFCFETLAARLEGRDPLTLDEVQQTYTRYRAEHQIEERPPSSSSPPVKTPLFVTWDKTENVGNDSDYHLRGCIGTFEEIPLADGLADYALIAALRDTRFSPIERRELPFLQVAVTLLTDFEPAGDAFDWELGKHGLRISFTHGGRRYDATYLPDVPPEQGWNKEETLVSLMRKAGWSGQKKKWSEVKLNVVRYQGKKESLGYAEYILWRKWVDENQ